MYLSWHQQVLQNRSLDIVSDHQFIQANEMFKGITRVNKKEGRGEIEPFLPIEPEDFQKLSDYF